MYSIWHSVLSILGGLEVIRTDFIALYCIVPSRNLQGLPKHLNAHPRVSEQNLLPQNMVWRTREASQPPGDPTLEGPRIRPRQDFPNPTPQGAGRGIPTHQTPHHRGGGGFPINPTTTHTAELGAASQTIWGVGGGRGARDHIYIYICIHMYTFGHRIKIPYKDKGSNNIKTTTQLLKTSKIFQCLYY